MPGGGQRGGKASGLCIQDVSWPRDTVLTLSCEFFLSPAEGWAVLAKCLDRRVDSSRLDVALT